MTERDTNQTDIDRLADLQQRTRAHLDRLAAVEAEEATLGAEIDAHLSRQRLCPEAEALIAPSTQTACPRSHTAWAEMDRGALQPDRRARPVLGRYYRCRLCSQHFLRQNPRPARRRARRIEAALRERLAQQLPIAGLPPGARLYYRLTPAGGAHAGLAHLELRATLDAQLYLFDFDVRLQTFVALPPRQRMEADTQGWRRWGSPTAAHPDAAALLRAREAQGYVP